MKQKQFCSRWEMKPLGETLPIQYGKALPAKERDINGTFSVYGSNGVAGRHSVALTSGATLLIGRKGCAGAVHFSPEPCWVIDTAYYTTDDTAYNLKFAHYLLEFLRLDSLDKSTTIPSLSRDDYNSSLGPLPTKVEQGEIVAKLDELLSDLDAGIANIKRAQVNLTRYRSAVLTAAVEGHLTAEWRNQSSPSETGEQFLVRILKERRIKWEADQLAKFAKQGKIPPKGWQSKYVEPAVPRTSDLPKLPDGWCWASLGQLAEIGTGTTPLKSNSDFWMDGTIPWVTSAAVNQGTVSKAESFVTQKALEETTLRLYPPGTLILAMYGEGKTRGKASELCIEATINQALAALVLSNTETTLKPYLKLFLASHYEELRRKAAGGVQPNLNLSLVAATAVPLPPVPEQAEIVKVAEDALSVITHTNNEIATQLTKASSLRQTILNAAFSGKLLEDSISNQATDEAAA